MSSAPIPACEIAQSVAPVYVVITPVRNEVGNFAQTIASFAEQTVRPAVWVIVDDGSTDGTEAIADTAACEHPWIKVVHRQDRGFRKPGSGVVEAFYDGLAALPDIPWEFLVKFDGDLAFAPDYFQRCLTYFASNPKLGIAGGLICMKEGDSLTGESTGDPAFHVRGATKIYRRNCWEQIGGLVKAPGWDSIDELKANMLGWTSATICELKLHQLKNTGSADGAWRNWIKNGLANYITGYHPIFMAAKCLKRMWQPPFGVSAIGLAYGYLKGYLCSIPQVQDGELIDYVRRQQINRLLGRPSIWKKTNRELLEA
jgi:poly-beta-1,6-N-acetyl-D-glucosamine synthase